MKMTKAKAVKMLKTEEEIICINKEAQILFASLALEMLYSGKSVKAKLVQGWK